tara:strand:+ start:74 stop:484 length:411 start_codon:yes stop_codon:yes gene_type:complete
LKILIKDSATGLIQIREVWQRMKQALDSGVPLVMEITRENRSLPQNALIHSIINQISAQAQHLGSTWDAESWKRLLVDAYTREIGQNSGQVIPNLTGDGIVQLGLQTRKFTKQQASEFSEWLMAWAAQNGVTINEG